MSEWEYWGRNVWPISTCAAAEEYNLKKDSQQDGSVAMFYVPPRETAVLGYAQAPDVVLEDGLSVARRASGGNHVYLKQGNTLCYSVVTRKDIFSGVRDMRKYFADHIVEALSQIGLEDAVADNETSTISVNGRIVGGHSLVWGIDRALLHGFIIYKPYDMGLVARKVALQSRKINGEVVGEYDLLKAMTDLSSLVRPEDIQSTERSQIVENILTEVMLKQFTGGKYSHRSIEPEIFSKLETFLERRYQKNSWIYNRVPAFSEDEVEEIPGEELKGKLKEKQGYCLYMLVPDKDFEKMA